MKVLLSSLSLFFSREKEFFLFFKRKRISRHQKAVLKNFCLCNSNCSEEPQNVTDMDVLHDCMAIALPASMVIIPVMVSVSICLFNNKEELIIFFSSFLKVFLYLDLLSA